MGATHAGRVAVVTGAGRGIGAAIAAELAARGAKVAALEADPGLAEAAGAILCDVADRASVDAACARVEAELGPVDILVNNAGILRDKTFAKMDLADFRTVLDVHLMGSVICTKAVWEIMREAKYGRIVMTTSSTGLYGNFGQTNYGAAKLALVGFMQTLGLEGEKYGIRVNALAPTAATRMTEGLLPPGAEAALAPAAVSPGVVALVSEDAPNRAILCAGAGSFELAHITLTRGAYIGTGDDAAEQVLARFDEIADRNGETVPVNGNGQAVAQMENLQAALGR